MTSHGHDTTGAGTLVHLLRRTAADQPEGKVFSAIAGEAAGLTFADLDRAARAVASALQHAKVGPGERALLFYPPGLSLVPALFGCLYAGVVAVPSGLVPARGALVLRRLGAGVEGAVAAGGITAVALSSSATFAVVAFFATVVRTAFAVVLVQPGPVSRGPRS